MINGDFISLHDINKVYHTTAGDFVALQDVNVCFQRGEFVSVVGKSGSGKSTLMNMITGIDKPSSGEVIIADQPVHKFSETAMAKWRGKNLGIIFQFYQLLPVLTLLENVMLPMQIAGVFPPEEHEVRAHELLARVGLADYAHKRPHSVSGGQQQSTAIARALANDPPILIADEPTGNLGTLEGENIIKIFEQLSEQDKTIIMVTHDNELADRAQRVLMLKDGILTKESHNGKVNGGCK
ncbi:MAG: ABC transporter ATP-binding protein [Anaerolineales bacterium]|nr:ABC transporter ATP-binding protein [Anaerolineales bacterium]